MSCNLERRVVDDIVRLAQRNGVHRVILFGSRARGDNTSRSDIDLAVSGGNARDFHWDLEEEAWTLLMFDVVPLDEEISPGLRTEIDRDGILLYEKT